jgi:hypothetical protein
MTTDVTPETMVAMTAVNRLAREAALMERARKGQVGALVWFGWVAATLTLGGICTLATLTNAYAAATFALMGAGVAMFVTLSTQRIVASRLDAIVQLLSLARGESDRQER